MNSEIITALITAFGVITAALLGDSGKKVIDSIRRRSLGYPDIRGTWEATWHIDGQEQVYNTTIVKITKLKTFQIYGKEIDPKKTFDIRGRFSRNHIINLIYESMNPSIILSGVVTLKVDPMGKTCKGFWSGYTKEDCILAGKVVWKRTENH